MSIQTSCLRLNRAANKIVGTLGRKSSNPHQTPPLYQTPQLSLKLGQIVAITIYNKPSNLQVRVQGGAVSLQTAPPLTPRGIEGPTAELRHFQGFAEFC
jgi:hypothetical protein